MQYGGPVDMQQDFDEQPPPLPYDGPVNYYNLPMEVVDRPAYYDPPPPQVYGGPIVENPPPQVEIVQEIPAVAPQDPPPPTGVEIIDVPENDMCTCGGWLLGEKDIKKEEEEEEP